MIYLPFHRLFSQANGVPPVATVTGGFVSENEALVDFLAGKRPVRPWQSPRDFGLGYAVDAPPEIGARPLVYDPATRTVSLDIASRGLSLHMLKQQMGRNGIKDVWSFLSRHRWEA